MQPFGASPAIGSPDWWHNPERVPAASDPAEATAQTIRIMCGHVAKSKGSPGFGEWANQAAEQFGGRNEASAFWWCKHFIKFVHHEFILRDKLGEAGHLQGLIAPDALVQMDSPEGDCAIFTMMVCAFLKCFGIPFEMVTVAVNPNEPDIFSHVYCYAVMPDGTRIPLDASHGKFPGWQVPSSDVTRRQAWDEAGNPVADRGSRFDGLHNYVLRAGLNDLQFDPVPDYTNPPTDSGLPTDYYNPTQVFGSDLGWETPSGAPYSGPTYSAPSQNSAQWAQFASSLAKAGLTLAEINAIQPGTVVGANGQILRQNPGYAVPVGSAMLPALGGNSMLYLGGALVALLIFGSMMKGGR